MVNCKWVENGSSTYDKAYKINGVWHLVWNDESVKHPDAIQCRRIAISETSQQTTKDLLLCAMDTMKSLEQEIKDQLEHIQILEEEIRELNNKKATNN